MQLKRILAAIALLPFLTVLPPAFAYETSEWTCIVQPGWDGPPRIRAIKSTYDHPTLCYTPDHEYVLMVPDRFPGGDTVKIKQQFGQPQLVLMTPSGRSMQGFDGIWGGPWRGNMHTLTAQEAKYYLNGSAAAPAQNVPPATDSQYGRPQYPQQQQQYSDHPYPQQQPYSQRQQWSQYPGVPPSRGQQDFSPPTNYNQRQPTRNISLANDAPRSYTHHSPPKVQALFFATDTYSDSVYPHLANPVSDATALADELQRNYHCQTEVVQNPTTDQIVTKLRDYAKRTYADDDQLMVYFAGHGYYDPIDQMGYLIESNSNSKDVGERTMLSAPDLLTRIGNIKCKHILVCLDVCHAGTFINFIASQYSQTRGVSLDQAAGLDALLDDVGPLRTRKLFVSSMTRSASDGRPGEHSPFAAEFLHSLRSDGRDRKFLTLTRLSSDMQGIVTSSKTFCLPTDDEGEFFFVHN